MVVIRQGKTPLEFLEELEVVALGEDPGWRIPLVFRHFKETNPDITTEGVRKRVRELAISNNLSVDSQVHLIALDRMRREGTTELFKRIKCMELAMYNVMKHNRPLRNGSNTIRTYVLGQLASSNQIDLNADEHEEGKY